MKTATIPPVRIEPEFREEIEQLLEADESMASMVVTALRHEVQRRRVDAEFVQRGMTAVRQTLKHGDGVSAEAMLNRLEQKLVAAKQRKAP